MGNIEETIGYKRVAKFETPFVWVHLVANCSIIANTSAALRACFRYLTCELEMKMYTENIK